MVLALEHGECMTSLVLDVVKMVFLFVFEWKRKRKMLDKEDWENIDTAGDEAGEKAIYYNDDSNEDPLSDESDGDF